MLLTARLRLLLLVTSFGLLAACNSDDNGSRDERTALQADPDDEYARALAPVGELSDLEIIRESYRLIGESETLMLNVMDRLDSAWEGEGLSDDPDECSNANDNLGVVYESSATRDYVRYQADDCIVPGYGEAARLDGTIEVEITEPEDGNSIRNQTTYDFEGSRGGRDLEIVGSRTRITVTHTETRTETREEIAALEYLIAGDYMAIRDSETTLIEDGDSVSKSSHGDFVASELDGYVEVSTPVTVAYDAPGECPDRGHLKFVGIGKLDVRYGENSAKGTGVEQLLNGSEVQYADTCDMDVPGVGTQPGDDA